MDVKSICLFYGTEFWRRKTTGLRVADLNFPEKTTATVALLLKKPLIQCL